MPDYEERQAQLKQYAASVAHDVWRMGGDANDVSRECTDDCYDNGRHAEECAQEEVRRQRPQSNHYC